MAEDAAAVGDEPKLPEFSDEELERQEQENLKRFRELLREIPRG